MKLLFLLLLPALASAQPPGYTCTHWNDYYAQGVPPPGSPNECEAVGNAAQGSFTYFFFRDQAAISPQHRQPPKSAHRGR